MPSQFSDEDRSRIMWAKPLSLAEQRSEYVLGGRLIALSCAFAHPAGVYNEDDAPQNNNDPRRVQVLWLVRNGVTAVPGFQFDSGGNVLEVVRRVPDFPGRAICIFRPCGCVCRQQQADWWRTRPNGRVNT